MIFRIILFLFLLLSPVFAEDDVCIDGVCASGHIVQDEGTTIQQTPYLNFTGSGVTASNSGGKTNINVAGTGPFSSLFVTGGAYLAYSSGNVGIGTTLPTDKLYVQGGLTVTGAASLGSFTLNTLSVPGYAYMAYSSGNAGIGTTAPLGLLQVGTSPAPALICTKGGFTGIGTTLPSYLLDVAGSLSTSQLKIGTLAGMLKATAGTVGIGTSGTDYYNNSVQIDHDATTNFVANEHIDWTSTSSNLSTSGTASFGNTGIGTTSGANGLFVAGTTRLQGNVGIGGSTGGYVLSVTGNQWTNGTGTFLGNVGIGTSASSLYALWVHGSMKVLEDIYAANEYVTDELLGTSGNMGVGTTAPTHRLDVIGGGTDIAAIMGTNVGIGVSAFTARLQVGTTPGLPLLIVKDSGNIGIGTSAPTAKLQIVGDSIFQNITAGTWSGDKIDISDKTNLSGDTENVLTGDALSIAAAITRDTEWNGLDFLVGTATGSLSAEIAVGATPGGELGGTWASPTIDDSVAVSSWTLTTPTFSGIVTTGGNYLSGDGGAEGIAINTTGNVGIGNTAPQGLLDAGTNPGKGLIVLSNGNVGIGTTAPAAKLQVAGSIESTGGIFTTIKTYDTVPILGFNIANPDTTPDGVGLIINNHKNYVVDALYAQIRGGGTNVIFDVKVVGPSGTSPTYNLCVGQTAVPNMLTVTSFTNTTIPAGYLVVMDTTSVAGIPPLFHLQIDGHEY